MYRIFLKLKFYIIFIFICLICIYRVSYANSIDSGETLNENNYRLEDFMPQTPIVIKDVDSEVAETYRNILPTINELAKKFIKDFFDEDVINHDNLDKLLTGLQLNKTKSFSNELIEKSKNLGKFIDVTDMQVIHTEGSYETVAILKFEKGNLTVNLQHSKTLPYLIFSTSKNINIEDYLLDKSDVNSVFTDYYISNGIHLNQVSALRSFSKNIKLFLIVIVLFIIIFNLYSFIFKKHNNTKINNYNDSQTLVHNDTHMTAVITAAINAYLDDNNKNKSSNGIFIRTIRKTNWNKID